MPKKFSASNAEKFSNCHGAANLELAIPNWVEPEEDPTVDNAANRGSQMHAAFASMMQFKLADTKQLTRALGYVNDVRSRGRFKMLVEEERVADWLPSEPTTTVDLVLHNSSTLHVLDLKTGRIKVDVWNNPQLLFYAATFLDLAPRAKEVHLHIVQPWADNMEEHVVPVADLLQWMIEMQRHDLAITAGDTTLMPGDHCMFCPANPHGRGAKGKPYCPAMMQVLYPSPTDHDALLEEWNA